MIENNSKSNDRVSVYLQEQNLRACKLLNKKNSFFYFSMVLCGVITLVIAWVIESNTRGVVKMPDCVSVGYLLLIVLIIGLIALISVFVDYLFLYKNARPRRFWMISGGLLLNNSYELCSLNRQKIMYQQYLNCNGVEDVVSKKLVAGKVISEKFSKFLYSIMVLLIGTIFALKNTNIYLYVLSIIIVFWIGIGVLLILLFDKIKEKYVYFIARLSKFLYKCKLINNYENFYNNRIAKFVYYGSELRANRLNVIVQTLANIVVRFLKHLILRLFVVKLPRNNFEKYRVIP